MDSFDRCIALHVRAQNSEYSRALLLAQTIRSGRARSNEDAARVESCIKGRAIPCLTSARVGVGARAELPVGPAERWRDLTGSV